MIAANRLAEKDECDYSIGLEGKHKNEIFLKIINKFPNVF
jgi:hypothetical protein